MTTSQKIKLALTYKNISISKLARELGVTPQALSQRLTTDKFSTEDLTQIAKALDAEYIPVSFAFPDGTKI